MRIKRENFLKSYSVYVDGNVSYIIININCRILSRFLNFCLFLLFNLLNGSDENKFMVWREV